MAEQTAGTPESNSGASKEKPSNAKDRACPFCKQQFTSSSLGRHLDLYIKEKHPKPADGIHHVEEIRKIRGHITRRQPRNSMSKRESSMPAGTPAASRRSPSLATGFTRKHSPSAQEIVKTPDDINYAERVQTRINHPNWEATGVMNDIPSMSRNGHSQSSNWDADAEDDMHRRHEDGRRRSMSKQMLAKSTFEQKQKMLDALDNARAAELALREVLGSIRAANERNQPTLNGPLDYDPLTLDFSALCLHCLPAPPTLYQTAPIASPNSWSVEPPDYTQRDALVNHFQGEFKRWRLSTMIAERRESEESTESNDYTAAYQEQSRVQEEAIMSHIKAAFAHWNTLAAATRVAHWRLELARSIGRKASLLKQMKENQLFLAQENAHLRAQVEQLSRLQSPREFRISGPKTYPISPETMHNINEIGLMGAAFGFELSERKEDMSALISKAIARWKAVVQSSRGMPGQKRLDPMNPQEVPHSAHALPAVLSNEDADGEGERDVDMEADDTYTGMSNGTAAARAPGVQMGLADGPTRYGSNNGLHTTGESRNNGTNRNLTKISDFEQDGR